MSVVKIYRKQCLEILQYTLHIFPALIPHNFTIFTYNRVINHTNSNILQEANNNNNNRFVEDHLAAILNILDKYKITYSIEEDIFHTNNNKGKEFNVPIRKVKSFMKNYPLWAMNETLIIKLPLNLLIDYNKVDYISDLIERSIAVRKYLDRFVINPITDF